MKPKRRPDWPAVAAALAEAIPVERLHPRVRAQVQRNARTWAVAISGGADSLALLLLVWAHWPRRRGRLLALHFDHRLRSRREARAEQALCAQVCRDLDIPLHVGEWAEARAGASEAAARKARHAFFARQLADARCRHLWLGHQQEDVAETLLMRLGRGSGAGGLAAPRPVQIMASGLQHLRPLLTVKKSELIEALRAAGGAWQEDSSNATGDYLRNRVRQQVLPAWLAAHRDRDALAGAALARELLEEDDDALQDWLKELDPLRRDGSLDLGLLANRPRALVRRALHAWLAQHPHGSDLSKQGFDQLLAAVEASKSTRFSLGAEGFALIRRRILSFERKGRRASSRKRSNKAVLN